MNIKYKNYTGIILLLLLLVLLVWDIFLATNEQSGDTISEVLSGAPLPGVLFVGYLMGHFWPIDAILKRLWTEPNQAAAETKD